MNCGGQKKNLLAVALQFERFESATRKVYKMR